jgi:hypothetical protein
MISDLLIGVMALIIAAGAVRDRVAEQIWREPRFLQFYAAPSVYPAVVLVFLALGVAELISWAATMKW